MRIVGLNTILYYTANKAVNEQGDISAQFKWLEDKLTAARRNGEKVLITAHIQPGVVLSNKLNFYSKQHKTLVAIFRRFADVIVAMHFGHEHTDGFKLLTNDASLSIPIFYAPSVTPIRFGPIHSPVVRLVKYDRHTKKNLDFAQYYIDLATANRKKRTTWKQEYNFTDAYGVVDISTESLMSVAKRMKDENSSEFNKYFTFHYVSALDDQRKNCDIDCHATVYCGLTEFSMREFNTCVSRTMSGAGKLSPTLILVVMNFIYIAYGLSE